MKRHQTRKDAIMAWHFVNDDRRLRYDATSLTVEPGYIYYTDSPIVLCKSGLHASVHPFDALEHATGSQLCRVAVWGDVEIGDDKIAGRNREVLAMADVSRELRLFACWCVRQQWHLLTDERSRKAVEVAEKFANGAATEAELASARDAAWDTARYVTWDATWDAARCAARCVAGGATWDATWDAARCAARCVAGGVAGGVMINARRTEFERVMLEKFGGAA